MYRGGFVVDAQDCDYDSARLLGLTCPFCKEAVYVRAGTSYVRPAKQVSRGGNIVDQEAKLVESPQTFCHYEGKGQECEYRSTTTVGQQDIERLEIEARNQRLDLYNQHLWSMYAAIRPKADKFVSDGRKAFRDRYIEKKARSIQADLNEDLEPFMQSIEQLVKSDSSVKDSGLFSEAMLTDENLAREADQKRYFSAVDKGLHLLICKEIVAFLSTRTGRYALKKMVAYQLELYAATSACEIEAEMGGRPHPHNIEAIRYINRQASEEVKGMPDDLFKQCLLVAIVGTRWVEQIRDRLSPPDR